ncbi:UPF0606 protein KIAA1549L-like, partial [Tupaia chinensis]|uniref:UPF0606 protein KIAA1549L-like n=1 Tax=Tupaia chinensis TaxID=246437 RepID=UPI000FFC2AB3
MGWHRFKQCSSILLTGAGDLQTNVTLTPESLPPGKLLASSAAWPFSDIQASRATDRIKTVLGQSPDSVRRPQAAPTPPPRPHRRSWAHADFSPALHQGSGQSAPLEPPEDAEPLAQPRPPGERGSAAVSALAPLPHPPPAPRSPVRLPGRTPSQSILQMASNPASAELGDSQGAVPLGTSRHTAESPEAETLLLQTANSVAMEMTHRTLASAAAHSVNPPPPSESPGEPALSTELASSPLPALPLTAAGPGQAVLPGAALGWPGPGMAGFPSALPLQPAESPASAPWVPESPGLPGEASGDQSLLATATHLPLSSNFPDLLSTAWAIPWQDEDGVAALLGDSRKTNELAAPQAPPTLEVPSPQPIHRPTSDFSTDCASSPATTAPRTQPLPLGSSVPFLPCTHAPRPGFSSTKPESLAAAADLEGVPISASKQVTGLPFSTDVGGSTGGVEQPAAAEVSRSPLSVETGSLPTELALSGPQQQTHSHLNGHVINPTSWETHSASPPPQGGPAAGAEQPQGLQDMVGHTVTAEGLSTQERDLGSNLNQPIRPSGGTVIGNHVGLWPTSENNHSRDFQATEVERYPSASQRPPGRLQLPARPARPLLLTWPGLAPAARLQEMLSDGMETGWRVSSDTRASPVTGVSGPPHSALSFHSAFSRTLSKVLWASQRPRKWRGAATSAADSPEPSKAEPTAAAALPLRRVSPQAQSAAL